MSPGAIEPPPPHRPPPPPPPRRPFPSKSLGILSVFDSSRSFSISPEPDNAPPLERFFFYARGNVMKRDGSAATNPITTNDATPNNPGPQQDREDTVEGPNTNNNANMAPPRKTEAEKKAHKAKKARERRERKKTNAKAEDNAAAVQGPQELTPAPSGRATETPHPLDNLTNALLGQNDKNRGYDTTHTGAKVVNRKRATPEEEIEQQDSEDEEDDQDDNLQDFDHLTELVGQVTTLKLERVEQDKVDDKAEEKYNLAKRLYGAGNLSKKAFDVKAKEWEISLKIGIAAYEARKVKLVNLENDIDREFRRIATRMLVANDSEAAAGSILEDFQDLSMYNRKGFTRVGNDLQQKNTQREAKEKRESRIGALADFWTLGLGRDSKDFDQLLRSLTRKTKDNVSDKNNQK